MSQSLTTMISDLQITKPVHSVVENSYATEKYRMIFLIVTYCMLHIMDYRHQSSVGLWQQTK